MNEDELLIGYKEGKFTSDDVLNFYKKIKLRKTYPLSECQTGLWMLQKTSPESKAYNLPLCLRIKDELDVDNFKKACQFIVDQYPILSSRITEKSGRPYFTPGYNKSIDFCSSDQTVTEKSALTQIIKVIETPIDLAIDSLIKFRLYKLDKQECIFLVVVHHLVFDGTSIGVFMKKLALAYKELLGGKQPEADYFETDFNDFVSWEQEFLTSNAADEMLAYWKKTLSGTLPVLELDIEKKSIVDKKFQRKTHKISLSTSQSSLVRNFCSLYKISAAVFFLGLYKILLSHYSRNQEIIVGLPTMGRPSDKFNDLIGYFINMLSIRSAVDVNESCIEFFEELAGNLADALDNGLYPFPRLISRLGLTTGTVHHPVFQVAYNFETDSMLQVTEKSDRESIFHSAEYVAEIRQEGQYKLYLEVDEFNQCFNLSLNYNACIYSGRDCERFMSRFNVLMNGILENPRRVIHEISLLSQDDIKELIPEEDLNQNRELFSIHALFESQVKKRPDSIGVVYGTQYLSYSALNIFANRLACKLLNDGIISESRIGICLERSPEMVVAILAILKLGACYVPLDPKHPEQRLLYCCNDARISLVITAKNLASLFDPFCDLLLIDSSFDEFLTDDVTDIPEINVALKSLIYIIYTSGSTGQAKGVAVCHEGVNNLLNWYLGELALSSRDSFLLVSSLCFDLTQKNVLACLAVGGRLNLANEFFDPEGIVNLLVDHRVSYLNLAPSAFYLLANQIEYTRTKIPEMKCVVLGGEPIQISLLKTAKSLNPHLEFINSYGPTECSDVSTLYRLTELDYENDKNSIPIGKAIPNVQTYVFDESYNLTLPGVVGELLIGGSGVARAYTNQPRNTALKFVPNPFGKFPGERLYRSGDLVRQLGNNNLEFIGRSDHQVKFHGYRFEPSEIESVINRCAEVENSVILYRKIEDKEYLGAYCKLDVETAPVAYKLASFLEAGQLSISNLITLPNGLDICALNMAETQFVFEELFIEKAYERNGIVINDGDCIFDVGANVGMFGIYLTTKRDNLKIFAFEPIKPIFDMLTKNCQLYGNGMITACNVGLSDAPKKVEFIYYPNHSIVSGINLQGNEDVKSEIRKYLETDIKDRKLAVGDTEDQLEKIIEDRLKMEKVDVYLSTISDQISAISIESIQLLKIDVERSEYSVLAGIEARHWDIIEQVVVEVHDLNGSLTKIEDLLSKHGFKVTTEKESSLRDTNIYMIYATKDVNANFENEIGSLELVDSSLIGLSGVTKNISNYIKTYLPEYMVPSCFTFLTNFKLNNNGKIDRECLTTYYEFRLQENYQAPRNHIETILCDIWTQLLNVDVVGIDDNFFSLGGDSIISIQFSSRIKEYGFFLSGSLIFDYPTVRQLAPHIETQALSIDQAPSVGYLPSLLPIHHWLFNSEAPNLHHFQQSQCFTVTRSLSIKFLREFVVEIVKRHDAFRLCFRQGEEGWCGKFIPLSDEMLESVLVHKSLVGKSVSEIDSYIRKFAEEVRKNMSLESGPLLKIIYFESPDAGEGGATNYLLFIVHHLVVDAVSWRIISRDFTLALNNWEKEGEIGLAAKTTSYQQWSALLEKYFENEVTFFEKEFWKSQFKEPASTLKANNLHVSNDNYGCTDLVIETLSVSETYKLLNNCNQAYKTRIQELLISALLVALHKWNDEIQILIDLEGHGRDAFQQGIDLSETVGWFTSVYPLNLSLPPAQTDYLSEKLIGVVIKHVKEQLRQVKNGGLGFGILRYLCKDEEIIRLANAHVSPLLFNYLGQFKNESQFENYILSPAITTGLDVDISHPRAHQLGLNCVVQDEKLIVQVDYNRERHDRESMEEFICVYMATLRAVISHCSDIKISTFTPSDFPLIKINQNSLDRVLQVNQNLSDIYPATSMQLGLIYQSLRNETDSMYNCQYIFEFNGEFNLKIFKAVWKILVGRYDIFRTTFMDGDGSQLYQIVKTDVDVEWIEKDFRGISKEERDTRFESDRLFEKKRCFKYSEGPLQRMAIYRIADNSYLWLWTIHHSILDGWSLQIVLKEMFYLYGELVSGEMTALPPIQPYKNYIGWLAEQDLKVAESFWSENLSGFNGSTSLEIGDKADAGYGRRYNIFERKLSALQSQQLLDFANECRVTPNIIIQAAWALIQYQYSDSKEVIFAQTFSGRNPEVIGIEYMVGLFINTLPIRIDIDAEMPLKIWLKNLHRLQVNREKYQFFPLQEIQDIHRKNGGDQLSDTLIVFENFGFVEDRGQQNTNLGFESRFVGSDEFTNFDLTLLVAPEEKVSFKLFYLESRFSINIVNQLLEHLFYLLGSMFEVRDRRVSELLIVSESERRKLLRLSSGEILPQASHLTIHGLFEERAASLPDRVAAEFGNLQLSYAELNRRANRLARHLIELGVGLDDVVGLYLDRSIDLLVGILAILKSGAGYVPLDPAYPIDRVEKILLDSNTKWLITKSELLNNIKMNTCSGIVLDSPDLYGALLSYSPENLNVDGIVSENLAYVIYTSGSTGQPKGVLQTHKTIINLVGAQSESQVLCEPLVCMPNASISFDVAVQEFVTTWYTGGKLILTSESLKLDGQAFLQEADKREVERLFMAPSLFSHYFKNFRIPHSVKEIIVAGEQLILSEDLQNKVFSKSRILLNHYGPTETHVASSYEVQKKSVCNLPPIGQPLANFNLYVLTSELQLAPVGVVGELYIAGAGLARGYLAKPGLTAQKFVPDFFSTAVGERMYKTGDLVRWLPDGVLEFIGRNDNQIKIRGYRIEIGEIESVIIRHPDVSQVFVTVSVETSRDFQLNDKRLLAYVTRTGASRDSNLLCDTKEIDDAALVDSLMGYCKDKLPTYMLPSAILVLSSFPVTTNGKVNRNALPLPRYVEASNNYLPPLGFVEEMLADIWIDLLRIKMVGRNDDFFAIGGNSLLAMQLIVLIQNQFQLRFNIVDLFKFSTLKEMAGLIEKIDNVVKNKDLDSLSEEEAELLLGQLGGD